MNHKIERHQILKELNLIFINVLQHSWIKLTETSTEYDIDDWESLCHIQLVVAIEQHFKIRFTTLEIQRRKVVSELIDIIKGKLEGLN